MYFFFLKSVKEMILLYVKYQSDRPLNAKRSADIQADSPGFSEKSEFNIQSLHQFEAKTGEISKALS